MRTSYNKEIKLFYCYAHKDQDLLNNLEIHISSLKRLYPLHTWHDRNTIAGEEWETTINSNLDAAHLILLLVSPDFLTSDHCYREMQRSLTRYEQKTCKVIPVLVRPTNWKDMPFSKLQVLPSNAIPITSWSNHDEALENIVEGIERAIENENQLNFTKDEWFLQGKKLFDEKYFKEALQAFHQVIRLSPNYIPAYAFQGIILAALQRSEEALAIFHKIVSFRTDPSALSTITPFTYTQEETGTQHSQVTHSDTKIIAIVEDNVAIADMVQWALEISGPWEAHIFRDARSAIDLLPQIEAHVVILDITNPTNKQVYKELKKQDNTKNIPIIILASARDWAYDEAIELPMGLLLRKPFRIRNLIAMVEALLLEA